MAESDMSDVFSEGSWEDFSVDSEGFSSDSDTSSHDDYEDDHSDNGENFRGAEPYRFEPLADENDTAAATDVDGEASQEEATDRHRLLNTDWCTCNYCIAMPNIENSKCCKEIKKFDEKLEETDVILNGECFTTHPWFEAVCLNPGTLQTAYLQYRQQYGARAVEGDQARKFRHVAYRQVVRWCWGYLGRENRVPLPSCVMRKIREVYPDADGNYQGFRYPPLDM